MGSMIGQVTLTLNSLAQYNEYLSIVSDDPNLDIIDSDENLLTIEVGINVEV